MATFGEALAIGLAGVIADRDTGGRNPAEGDAKAGLAAATCADATAIRARLGVEGSDMNRR